MLTMNAELTVRVNKTWLKASACDKPKTASEVQRVVVVDSLQRQLQPSPFGGQP
jgi:hypothetical protein